MAIDFNEFEQAFHMYTRPFLEENPTGTRLYQVKLDHTMRVYDYAKQIAKSTILSDETRSAALLAALFHDIGRFPQYQEYKTFNDRRSLNHAHLGIKVTIAQNFLASLPKSTRKLTLAAIALHNRADLPKGISQELLTITNVVRDSDKLDIFKVMLDFFEEADYSDPTITLDITPHPTNYTEKMYEDVLHKRNCFYSDMRWTNDFKLILANWVQQLNFPVSYKILRDSQNFDRLFTLLPDNNHFHILKDSLAKVIDTQLNLLEQTSLKN